MTAHNLRRLSWALFFLAIGVALGAFAENWSK